MPFNGSSRITRSSTSREFHNTIGSLFSGSDKLDLHALLTSQNVDNVFGETRPNSDVAKTNYLQALLGLNDNCESSSPIGILKSKVGTMRPRSVSFSTPEAWDGIRGFTINESDGSNSPGSPFKIRSHSSEAGSPTLEQVLLMGRDSPGTDAGYGSCQSGGGDNSPGEIRQVEAEVGSLSPISRTEERSFSPGKPRPTLSTLANADQAVAQAAKKFARAQGEAGCYV